MIRKIYRIFIAGMVLAANRTAGAVTPGWEDVNPQREEFPLSESLWQADSARKENFKVEFRDGALGGVKVTPQGICVAKTNDTGFVLVSANAFSVAKGTKLRFYCDVEIPDADVDYSTGFLRACGAGEDLSPSPLEQYNFWGGGLHTMRGMPNTPAGMTTRKFGQFIAEDGTVTPMIVVAGRRSTSFWRNWGAENHDLAVKKWNSLRYSRDPKQGTDHTADRMPVSDFKRFIARDIEHTAKIERRDGVSRLVIDGEIAAPAVFKAKHDCPDGFENFAGRPLEGGELQLMTTDVRLGGSKERPGLWTRGGFDAKKGLRRIADAMRCSPRSKFILAVSCQAYQEFTKDYPEERWLRSDGTPVMGVDGTCVAGYMMGRGAKCWPWVSYSSRRYREGVKKCIRELVAELKRTGLSKRIVGAHICGYHDGQFSVPYADHSPPAKAECRRLVERGGLASTDYNVVCKQTGFTAQEEFAREFKRAMGKDVITVIWCESPYNGLLCTSVFMTEFTRSDAVDVIVAQPHYRERLPAFPITSVIPTDSLHLHGKMFWNELDLRTYGDLFGFGSAWNSPVTEKSVGLSCDFTMWQTVYRKHAGEMTALRMGYWLYDMGHGWFSPPDIAGDIRRVVSEEAMLARRKPSGWQPDVAVVVDEGQFYTGGDEFDRYSAADDFIYAQQVRYFVSGGAPFSRYLAEDVLENPSLLESSRMVVFAFMRDIDARRRALLERLADKKRTLVFLSATGTLGGGDATGFGISFAPGRALHETRPEAGVRENVMSEMDVWAFRENPNRRTWGGGRVTVAEESGVKVLSRYVSDGKPAVAYRDTDAGRRVYVCEPGGLTPALFNRFARESGAYVALDREGVQLNMNDDFISLHCLRGGAYRLRLPFDCTVINLKTGRGELTEGGYLPLNLTAGETCRFMIERKTKR